MRITMRLTMMTPDVREAVEQTVDAFAAALAAASEREKPFAMISELAFSFGVAHPTLPPRGRGRASYHRDSETFYSEAWLEYDSWIDDEWAERVRAVADAARTALAAVHKTRLTLDERAALSRLIDIEADGLAASPPARLFPLKPVQVSEDEFGRLSATSYEADGAAMSILGPQRVRLLQPSEIQDYVSQQGVLSDAASSIKLYKRQDGQLLYREAWADGDTVVEHVGVCGRRGSVVEHAAVGAIDQRAVIRTIAVAARAEGFRTVPDSRHVGLLVEREISGWGTPGDLRRRHALEEFLNETTSWLGLGHCDGGSIGSGSMDAFCLVVDYEIAAEAIARELASSPFRDFNVRRADP